MGEPVPIKVVPIRVLFAIGVTSGKLGPTSMMCFSSWCWEGCHPGSPPIEQFWCVWDWDHAAAPTGCACVRWGAVSFGCRKKMVSSRFGELEDADRLLLEAKLLLPLVVPRECE